MNKEKLLAIIFNIVPIALMVGLVYLIKNDWWLLASCVIVIAISFIVRLEKKEISIFLFGSLLAAVLEIILASNATEFFIRDSLFGQIPVWLPFIWGYCFVAVKRISLIILED